MLGFTYSLTFSSKSFKNNGLIKEVFYKLANIAGASSHSGRRQFVSNLADMGINARVVQALARHKNLGTTQRYIDINDNKLRAAVELLS
jgi:integrase/recombinase XerD